MFISRRQMLAASGSAILLPRHLSFAAEPESSSPMNVEPSFEEFTTGSEESLRRANQWLLKAIQRNGGCGVDIGQQPDIGCTAMVGLALLSQGNTPIEGPQSREIRRIVAFLLRAVENMPADDITSAAQTQLQNKIGRHAHTFFATLFLSQVLGEGFDPVPVSRALEKLVDTLAQAQTSEGNWGSDSWAPVLGTVMGWVALRGAHFAGFRVEASAKKTADHLLTVMQANIKEQNGSWMHTLYKNATGVRVLYAQGLEHEGIAEKAFNDVLKVVTKDNTPFSQAGGEEYLAFHLITETMLQRGGQDWARWYPVVRDKIINVQNSDGSWAGKHCITSRTFCTAAAELVLSPESLLANLSTVIFLMPMPFMPAPARFFGNTGTKRKPVNRCQSRQRVMATLLVCFMGIFILTGCQQKPPPLPNKKTAAQKRLERERRREYAQEKKKLAQAEEVQAAIQHGVNWLTEQQAEDGGWHSQTYGNLKGGAATTALALYTISRLPEFAQQDLPAETISKAMYFLSPGLKKKGFVLCPDGSLDEPTYATALYLLALRRMLLAIPIDTREQMAEFLQREQCTEAKGFAKDDPNYGGWDLAGGSGLRGETPGTNVSITRFVMDCVGPRSRLSNMNRDEQEVVLAWAARVQNLPGDGGFHFHPQTDHEGNKAQWADETRRQPARSYGTATCDGLLLLADLEVPAEDPRMKAAVQWLVDHSAVDHVPGFEQAPPELDWQNGLLYYYLMTLSQALPHLPAEVQTERRQAIRDELLRRQQADGSWRNESTRMREDDPLIATCFALVALSATF